MLKHPAVTVPPAPQQPRPPPPSPRVPTWGGNFHDAHVALRGTFIQNAFLQSVQHSFLWELRQDRQVINWYVKLGPVVGNHALTVE